MKSIIVVVGIICCASASADRPISSPVIQKVVVISVDTLRADFLGCYNPKMKTSPELDQFAAENVICRNVTSQASTTAPSHKSIFYSVYPSIHKTSIRSVPQEKLQSPIETIRAKGFKTAAFTGGGQLSHAFGFARGFDKYWEPLSSAGAKHQIQETEAAAFAWLDQNYNDKFFLFLHTFEVHCPYDPPEKFFLKWSSWYEGQIRKENCYPNKYLRRPSNADYEYVRSLYSAEVNYVDSFLGDLFRKLKSLGIYDDTLIVFLSDHGESLGEKGYVGHSRLDEVELHVPLILHVPGVGPTSIDAPLESIDVMPTVFELLGIKTGSYPFQGRSLVSLIREPRVFDKNRPLISEERGGVRIRIGDLALCFFLGNEGREQLFNLRLDPQEIEDISDKNRKTVEQMKALYFQLLTRSKDLSAQFVLEAGKKPPMSEETIEQLKALGYVAQ